MENFWIGFEKRAADEVKPTVAKPAPAPAKPAPAKPAPAAPTTEQGPELAEVNAKLDQLLEFQNAQAQEKAQVEAENDKNQAYEQGKAEGMMGAQKPETMKGQPVQQQQVQ